MKKVHVSVVIPAHNEEKYVERCIRSVKKSASHFKGTVEIIVVCNRCTDRTKELALSCGARVVENEARCIASVRNAGIAVAKGSVILTIDCDNRMTPGTIAEAWARIRSGKYIGGGAPIRFERYSFPLWLNDMVCRVGFSLTGLYCGIFWAKKETFDAIGGFADMRAMEDVETARRLRVYGKKQGKRYGVLGQNYLINSTRKYDDFGDWLYFKLLFTHAGTMWKAARGDRKAFDELLDEMFYDYNDRH